MAATLVAHAAGQNTSGSATAPASGSINTTGATLLVAVLTGFSSAPGISDSKSNTWTVYETYGDLGGDLISIAYCSNPTVGSSHTFTAAATASFPGLAVAAFSGTQVSGVPDIKSGNGGSTGSTCNPGSATPAHDGGLIILGLASGTTGSVTVDEGFTITDQLGTVGGTSEGVALAYLNQMTAAAVNPTWSGSFPSSACCAAMTSFQTSGGAVPNSAMMQFVIGG